jgi:hypothetical protein
MDTARLRAIQHPLRAEELLESFVRCVARLPRDARRLPSARELVPHAARIAAAAEAAGGQWRAFTDERLTWIFVGDISLERSRERGRPVLTVARYDEHGQLEERSEWVRVHDDVWQRCDA